MSQASTKGEVQVQPYPYLTPVLVGDGWLPTHPRCFTPCKKPVCHSTRGWVDLRAYWNGSSMSHPPTGIQTAHCPASSKSLDGLHYPDLHSHESVIKCLLKSYKETVLLVIQFLIHIHMSNKSQLCIYFESFAGCMGTTWHSVIQCFFFSLTLSPGSLYNIFMIAIFYCYILKVRIVWKYKSLARSTHILF